MRQPQWSLEMRKFDKLNAFLTHALLFVPVIVQAEEIKIAVITELTGAGAAIGQECKDGAEIALSALVPKDQSGKYSFSLVFGDTQDNVKYAISEFNKLTRIEGADVVVVSRSKIAIPFNPLSKRAKIPVVGVSAHPDFVKGSPYSIRVYPNAEVEGSFIASHTYNLGKRKVALLTVEDEWNLSSSDAYARKFKELGGSIVYQETVSPSDSDFSTIAATIKNSQPDSIFMNLQIAQAGSFVKKLKELEVGARIFSNYWIQKREIIDVAGVRNVEGSVFGEVDSQRPKFVEAAKSLYPDKNSSPATYLCYVAVGTILHAAEQVQGDPTVDAFRKTLISINSVKLLDDVIPFRNREIQYKLKVRELRNGKVMDLET